jgi:hypothetical protein
MSFHALYVCRLANELNQLLQGATLVRVYSTDKNHLFIDFERNGNDPITLSFRVEGGKLYLYFPEPQDRPRHALDQFKPAWDKKVKRVHSHPGERSFHIDLGQSSLLFLCYGRQANVHYLGQEDSLVFRNKTTNQPGFSIGQLRDLASATWPENKEAFLEASFITPILKKNF